MLKKTITYKDFNDEEVTEDFFFHLSKAELVELQMSHPGGLEEAIRRIMKAEDGKAIIAEFKGIILSSYGERSPDGRHFVKTQELRDRFESSEAYSTLFMELVTDAEAAARFVNGIIPADLADQAAKLLEKKPAAAPAVSEENGKNPPEVRMVTKAEMESMSPEDLQVVYDQINRGEAKLVF